MDMPTISETAAGDKGAARKAPAPAENPRAADVRRASRPHGTDTTVYGAASDRSYGREGGAVHVHKAGGPAERALSDRARQMLKNLDEHGDVNGGASGGRREGVSAGGTMVIETRGGGEPAAKQDERNASSAVPEATAASEPAAGGQPAEAAKPTGSQEEKPADKPADTTSTIPPDPKLTAEVERLSAHNRKLVAELEHRAAPQLDDRMKALDEIERSIIGDPIGSMEKLFAVAIGAKDHSDPRVQRFMAGVYGDWTERELKVPMDKASRALFGSERNELLIERDKRERKAGEATSAEKSKAADRERTVRDTVTTLDRQLVQSKHGEKYPHLMNSELFDGVTPGQRLFTAIAHGIAAGDWDSVPGDDKLVEHYSTKLNKELEVRDQKLRAHYAPKQTPTSTATPTQPSDSSKDKAADAPAKPAEQTGVRTITNASASVAPPTPPKEAATVTPPAKDQKPPTFRNEADRRQWLARKWFDEAGS